MRDLPVESAFYRSFTGGQKWTATEELLAGTVELLHAQSRLILGLFGPKGTKIPDPIEIPRPYDSVTKEEPKRKKRPATVEEVHAELGALFGGAI